MTAAAGVELTSSWDEDGTLVVALRGELDLATVAATADGLYAAIERAGRAGLVVDLAELTFLDARGLALLASVRALAAQRDRLLSIRNARGEVDTVLRITGLDEFLDLPGVPTRPIDTHPPA